MLKIYKYNNLINFSAEIFMLDKKMARIGLNCWDLRLLIQGKLIDAYHWQSTSEPQTNYKEKDVILVVGNWATRHKERFQIIRSEITSYLPANDDCSHHSNSHPLDSELKNSIKVNREEG